MALFDLLAEQGTRQMVIGGVSVVFGAAKYLYDSFRLDNLNCSSEEFYKKSIAIETGSILLPTITGLYESFFYSNPLGNNYFTEFGADLGANLAGITIGKTLSILTILGINKIKNKK